jgi:HSP20 family molecular chaperone IbpA
MRQIQMNLLPRSDKSDYVVAGYPEETDDYFKTLVRKHLRPVIRFRDEPDMIIIYIMASAMRKEDIRARVENGMLILSGKVKSEANKSNDNMLRQGVNDESFHRTFRLPETVSPEHMEIRFEHSMVTLKLPKKNCLSGETEVSLE